MVIRYYLAFSTLLLPFLAHSYEYQPAYVRLGTQLCDEEIAYRDQRIHSIRPVLQRLLDLPLDNQPIPRIALCCSGGGYRAMLATLGFLQGMDTSPTQRSRTTSSSACSLDNFMQWLARSFVYYFGSENEQIPPIKPPHLNANPTLFDACVYCSCLSGSSWAVAGWLQSGKTMAEYYAHVQEHIQTSLLANAHLKNMAVTLAQKYSYKQPLSLVDVYGTLLAQTLLSNLGIQDPNNFCLGAEHTALTVANLPLPLHSALIDMKMDHYSWVEFSPFEVGSSSLKSFIPTWAFGRKFKQGISQDRVPPASLGFCMGLWGSGMCLNAQEFLELAHPHLEKLEQASQGTQQEIVTAIDNALMHILTTYGTRHKNLLDRRLSPARVSNWNYGLRSCPTHDQHYLTLVDAGIDFRIALPPLLRPERAIDIIIVLDCSDRAIGTELKHAQEYATRNKLKFPPINYDLVTQPCSVHYASSDVTTPTIIYIPLVKHEEYHHGWDPRTANFTSTFNFKYTKEQSDLLSGLGYHAAIAAQPVILETIKEWIVRSSLNAQA